MALKHIMHHRGGGKTLSHILRAERNALVMLTISIVRDKVNLNIEERYSQNNYEDYFIWNTMVNSQWRLTGELEMGELLDQDARGHEHLDLIDFFILGDPVAVRLEWWEDRRKTGATPMQVMYVTAGTNTRVMSTKNPAKARRVFNALVADLQARLVAQGETGSLHDLDTDGEEI